MAPPDAHRDRGDVKNLALTRESSHDARDVMRPLMRARGERRLAQRLLLSVTGESAMTAIARIVVPVDFSTHADRAIDYALAMGTHFGACVELFHVVEDPFGSGGWGSEVFVSDLDGIRERAVKEAQALLEERRAAIPATSVPLVATVRMGHVAQTIVDYAAEVQADLIVMGTHGRTGVAHFIIGSVAERVVRVAPCPVLTVGARQTDKVHAAA
jgi:nucleotide-binding universal stress UspA family protein